MRLYNYNYNYNHNNQRSIICLLLSLWTTTYYCCNTSLAFVLVIPVQIPSLFKSQQYHNHHRRHNHHQHQLFSYNNYNSYNNNEINEENEETNNTPFEMLVQEATHGSDCSIGGDFAGVAATFNPGDGSFIPIPDYLIPDALKEWGQEPKCLEVLVSEDIYDDDNDDNDDNDDGPILTRITTTILPETGCGVDNLETVIAKDEIDLESQWRSSGDNIMISNNINMAAFNNYDTTNNNNDDDNVDDVKDIIGLQYPIGDDELRLETIFGLDDDDGLVSRIRVAIDVIPSQENFAIQTPMVITLERRTSSISSGGTISNGGGLDGRTVSMLLGERLRSSKTFVDEPTTTTSTATTIMSMGSNRSNNCNNNNNNNSYYHQFGSSIFSDDNNENENDNDIHLVNLPANISIAYGWLHTDEDNDNDNDNDSWMIQVGHTGTTTRRVVSRQFTVAENGELLDFEIRSWNEDFDDQQKEEEEEEEEEPVISYY
jgi:hypothetical protein